MKQTPPDSFQMGSLEWKGESVTQEEVAEYRIGARNAPIDILCSNEVSKLDIRPESEQNQFFIADKDERQMQIVVQSRQNFVTALSNSVNFQEGREYHFLWFTQEFDDRFLVETRALGDIHNPEDRASMAKKLSDDVFFNISDSEYVCFVKKYGEKLKKMQDHLDKMVSIWKPWLINQFKENINGLLDKPFAEEEIGEIINSVAFRVYDPLDHQINAAGGYDSGQGIVYVSILNLLDKDVDKSKRTFTHEMLHALSTPSYLLSKFKRTLLGFEETKILALQSGVEIRKSENGHSKYKWLNEAITQIITLQLNGAPLKENDSYRSEIAIISYLVKKFKIASLENLLSLYFKVCNNDAYVVDEEVLISQIAGVFGCDSEFIKKLDDQIEEEGVDATLKSLLAQV